MEDLAVIRQHRLVAAPRQLVGRRPEVRSTVVLVVRSSRLGQRLQRHRDGPASRRASRQGPALRVTPPAPAAARGARHTGREARDDEGDEGDEVDLPDDGLARRGQAAEVGHCREVAESDRRDGHEAEVHVGRRRHLLAEEGGRREGVEGLEEERVGHGDLQVGRDRAHDGLDGDDGVLQHPAGDEHRRQGGGEQPHRLGWHRWVAVGATVRQRRDAEDQDDGDGDVTARRQRRRAPEARAAATSASPLMACAKIWASDRTADVDEALDGDRGEHEDEDEAEAVEQWGAGQSFPSAPSPRSPRSARSHGRGRRVRVSIVPGAGLGHACPPRASPGVCSPETEDRAVGPRPPAGRQRPRRPGHGGGDEPAYAIGNRLWTGGDVRSRWVDDPDRRLTRGDDA